MLLIGPKPWKMKMIGWRSWNGQNPAKCKVNDLLQTLPIKHVLALDPIRNTKGVEYKFIQSRRKHCLVEYPYEGRSREWLCHRAWGCWWVAPAFSKGNGCQQTSTAGSTLSCLHTFKWRHKSHPEMEPRNCHVSVSRLMDGVWAVERCCIRNGYDITYQIFWSSW